MTSLLKRFDDASKHWDIASSVRPLINEFFRAALLELQGEMETLNKIRCGKCDGAKDLEHTLACKMKTDCNAILTRALEEN